jgi:hypothetical protein
MIRDIAADLRAVLPSTVRVQVRHRWCLYLAIGKREVRLTGRQADVLLRTLPTLPCAASEDIVATLLPHRSGGFSGRWRGCADRR